MVRLSDGNRRALRLMVAALGLRNMDAAVSLLLSQTGSPGQLPTKGQPR
jgi:hypothetical protein